MSEFSSPFATSSAPVEADWVRTEAPLPKGLKAICIIVIILGSMGILLSLASGAWMVFGTALQSAIGAQQPGLDPGMQEVQEKIQQESEAVASRYTPLTVVAVMMHLLTATLLLAGGIMTLKRHGKGASLLTVGCVLAIVYELGQGVLNATIQLQTIPNLQRIKEDVLARADQGAAASEAAKLMLQFMVAGVFVGLIFSVVLLLVKCIFYLISIFYLRKPQVTALFRQPDTMFPD